MMKSVIAALLLGLAALPAVGQNPAPTPAAGQPADVPTYTEEAGTEYVLLPVLDFD
jgi:hypothetical protein